MNAVLKMFGWKDSEVVKAETDCGSTAHPG